MIPFIIKTICTGRIPAPRMSKPKAFLASFTLVKLLAAITALLKKTALWVFSGSLKGTICLS